MAGETENLYYGRRPSLGPHGGERGYRTRPGAPMADPNRNIGGASYGPLKKGLSTPSNWDQMFHNYVTGLNPSGATGVPGTDSYVPKVLRGTNGGTLPDEPPEDQQARMGGSGRPTLQSMAQGGDAHTGLWSRPYVPRQITPNLLGGTGAESGSPGAIFAQYGTPGSTASYTARPDVSGTQGVGGGTWTQGGKSYGWGNAFDQQD